MTNSLGVKEAMKNNRQTNHTRAVRQGSRTKKRLLMSMKSRVSVYKKESLSAGVRRSRKSDEISTAR